MENRGKTGDSGLYFHIPYCPSRCRYCDFHSTGGAAAVPEAYVEALLAALARHRPQAADGIWRPATVYFGGGTPGLLSPAQVARLLGAARPLPGAEITLEMNPEGAEEEKLAGYRAAGVNRLSFGVQTAREDSLHRLGRRHTAGQARQALRRARAAGFTKLSGDIMLALPGYSSAEFDETLALLQEEKVQHISAYLLKIEPGTPFGKAPPAGLPTEDEAADFYLYAVERLEKAGYPQYEISNFARPGHESRHNLLYWDCRDYLGLGAAAHSCLSGRRLAFPPDTAAFIEGSLPLRQEGTLDAEDYLMLRLRLAEGLCEKTMAERFGLRLTDRQQALLGQFEKAGLARKTPGGWALRPPGLLVQNSLLAELLAAGEG